MRPMSDEIPIRLIELSDALNALTERQRVVIVLRYFADITDDEIAAGLDDDLPPSSPAPQRGPGHGVARRVRDHRPAGGGRRWHGP
jgi:hypothetical protein